jgi:putative flavoprotein involved in K+ transport
MTAEPIVIVGAGAAGLAAAWHSRQQGLRPLIVDRQEEAGGAWRQMRPDMRCLSHRRFDRLPDGSFPRGREERANALEVTQWLQGFFARSAFPTEFGISLDSVARKNHELHLETSEGLIRTKRLVLATGEHGRPYLPSYAMSLTIPSDHSSALDETSVRPGERVLVVGAGNSGAEITRLLLDQKASVLLSVGSRRVRHTAAPRGLWAEITNLLSTLPINNIPGKLGCTDQTPLVDSVFEDSLQTGLVQLVPRVTGVSEGYPVFADNVERPIDRVVWATGFSRETEMLQNLVAVSNRGQVHQRAGIVASDIGILGIPCMRTRRSGFLRGFSADAQSVIRALS